MARSEHFRMLQQGLQAWNAWRADYPQIAPNLERADLSEITLTGANLQGIDLYGANLSEANLSAGFLANALLTKANLIGADLRNAGLMGANLSHANLCNANLSGVNLNNKANLSHANLQDADLQDAELFGANLTGANLCRANLQRANLGTANLRQADLAGANLTGATLFEVIFTDTNLADVKGLDQCVHIGPSTIDHRTLTKSGPLPINFLRGCGLPDPWIECLPSLIGSPVEFYSCFISYSHIDKSFARRLHDQLQGYGIRCWFDEHQLLPGDNIYEQVAHGIRLWDKVLLCCSEASLTSWWVDQEITTAFARESQELQERGEKVLRLIPLNLDGYMFSERWSSASKESLMGRLAADFVGWEHDNAKFEEQLDKLLMSLRIKKSPPPPPSRI